MIMTARDSQEERLDGIRRRPLFGMGALALMAAAIAAVYVSVLDNAFVMDDVYLVAGADGLGDPDALGEMLLRPFWQNSSYLAELLHDYWRPVTTFALWLTAFVAGKAPFAFHALSLLGLAAATISFAALLRRFAPPGGRFAAVWLAVIFAAHPLAAEIVGMAANVSDHLALAFMAVQILVLDGHREREK
ncbi:MAG: hypothetical protein M0R80_31175, partial [Proteobacteria bacterium]|nr:hypothetical protein [Pseudomonadota bacterium]